ncbi:monocarboxylate transporter [Elysia marginata]|uniref:Monocarboxylate transporter n=1 Tax=Elysia marginata TaxID=1093978 RepID=A0AAV4IZ64_9GAST|nr:monocarboxylate transporter [Elysia marginata]
MPGTKAGCHGIHILVVGGIKALGVLIVEIRDRFDFISAKEMGLVQGLTFTLMMGLGLFTNMLAVRFSSRSVVFLGGLMCCAGFVMTAFITEFWMIYFTYSLTVGVGFGLAYAPSLVFVGSHFKERRSLANGLSMCGSGIGSFTLPNLMRALLHEYGLPGCCMLMGAIMLHVCICGLLFRPHANYKKKPRIPESQPGLLINDMPSSRSVVSAEDFTDEVDRAQNCATTDKETEESGNGSKDLNDLKGSIQGSDESSDESDYNKIGQVDTNCDESGGQAAYEKQPLLQTSINKSHAKSYIAPRTSPVENDKEADASKKSPKGAGQRIFDWSLLTNPTLFLFLIFNFFVGVAYPNIFFMLPIHAENIGEDRDSAALLLSFIGITDLFGRLFIGWFTDLKLFERRYALVACAFISGLLNLSVPYLKSFETLTAYTLGYGFCAGSYITLIPVVLTDSLGPEKLPSSFGMVTMALASTLIPAPLVCGEIRDATGSWDYAFVFAGISAVFGSLVPLLQPCVQRNPARRETDNSKCTSEV